MLRAGTLPEAEARRHADNAYVLVEFLSNTYPRLPEDAHERDLWVFLFDYYISQGPFTGPAVAAAPRSVRLFYDFLARGRPVGEITYIRAACSMEDFFARRAAAWHEIARAAQEGTMAPEAIDGEVVRWQDELTQTMRPRGLVPDVSLAQGEAPWGHDMGPLEAAVFDAVCVVLARLARDLSTRALSLPQLEERLLQAQDAFMRAHNPGLGASPLAAVMQERSRSLAR
jgi:hypothetical protein